ncbi:Wzz/FepE/Etk N-terminal domain-containing protein [Pedobacter sp.]|uniref:Wzz/FepE/Etk N-terminal domain-containing protein n=1 Tax=Pedobacter sp. TaxID=1411316 RepID=UPI003D7FDABF
MEQPIHNSASDLSMKEVILKFKSWSSYLWSKRMLILIWTIIGAILGITYSIVKKPVYTAKAVFALEESGIGGSLGEYSGIASMMGISLGGSSEGLFTGENILELYKSRNMLVKALLKEGDFKGIKQLLVERYIDSYKLRKSWSDKPRLRDIRFTKQGKLTLLQDSVLNEIVKAINKNILTVTKPDKSLSIIYVETKSIDQLFAKKFNDQVVANVNEYYVQTKTKKASQNLAVLKFQTDSVRRELNKSIAGVASTIEINPNPNLSRQSLKVPTQRRQVDFEANKAILVELVKSLEMSKVSLRKETPLIEVIDEPVLPLEKTKFGKLKGLLVGGFLGAFLSTLVLWIRKITDEILN